MKTKLHCFIRKLRSLPDVPIGKHLRRLSLLAWAFCIIPPADIWAGTTTPANSYAGGSGIESSPYLISTVAHLRRLQSETNKGTYATATLKYFKLMNNIDLSGEDYFAPIGVSTSYDFSNATFDGGGYTISGLKQTTDQATNARRGLFGKTYNAVIKNLRLENFEIGGYGYIGSLVGEATYNTTIENCHIKNGTVRSYYQCSGGLIGWTGGMSGNVEIRNSSVDTDVYMRFYNGDGSTKTTGILDAGGLIGYIDGTNSVTVSDCFVGTNLDAGVYSGHITVGGIIGYSNKSATLIRVVGYTQVYNIGNNNKASVFGCSGNGAIVTCKASYFKSTTYATTASWVSGAAVYDVSGSKWKATYTYLEYKGDNGSTITTPNKKWSYDGSYIKLASQIGEGPVIKITNNSSTTSSLAIEGYEKNGNDYYLNSGKDIQATPLSGVAPYTRYEYTFSGTTNGSGTKTETAWTFKPTSDGTLTCNIVKITYPTNVSGEFNQWDKIITLSWSGNNPNNLTGNYYIYRKENGTSSYTRLTAYSIAVKNGSAEYSQRILLQDSELGKKFDFSVCFVEGSGSAPSAPNSYSGEIIGLSTLPDVKIYKFAVTGQSSSILVEAEVPTQLGSNSTFKYSILRKKDDGSFNVVSGPNSFNTTGKISYTDGGITQMCEKYTYKLHIDAFGKNFYSDEITSNITGSNQVKSIKASKGEYPNQVRISWSTTKLSAGSSVLYKIFFREVNVPNAKWTELHTITSSDPNLYYMHDNVLAGIYYNYKVAVYESCGITATEVSSMEDIGFSQSLGTISGRITYGTGVAVENVNVLAVRNDLQDGESQYRSLYSNGEGGKLSWTPDMANYRNIIQNDFTLQYWLKPSADNTGTIKFGEIGHIGDMSLIRQTDGRYKLSFTYPVTTGGTGTLTGNQSIAINKFTHVALVRKDNVLSCYIVNDDDLSDIQLQSTQVTNAKKEVADATPGIRMGFAFKGSIDECRLWGKALTETEIRHDYDRILVGNEAQLKAYWTFDEGIDGVSGSEGYFFDVSRYKTIFNDNHGRHTLISDTLVPASHQLALKAITNKDGNYQISGIPFSGGGCSYEIVPEMGVHQFQPGKHLRYVNNTSLVHNGTDFADISSFKVSGDVTYEGGTYPVEGCSFQVDGKTLVHSDGSVITSDVNGEFTISVPIGIHEVKVVKQGHTFADNGLLLSGGKNINYNMDLPGMKFHDRTKIKLIGHIVGGLGEHEKTVGFGETTNNTGTQKVVLKSAKGDKYDMPVSTATYQHNDGTYAIWRKSNGLSQDTTRVEYKAKDITIHISPATGEYVAWVYPEVYTIQTITAPGYVEDIYSRNEILDLTKAPVPDKSYMQRNIRTWNDTVTTKPRPGELAGKTIVEHSDTVLYHAQWAYYYQAVPSFSVKQLAGSTKVNYFGDTEFTIENSLTGVKETVPLVNMATADYYFDAPVFIQGKKYRFALNAYEEYKNNVTGKSFRLPVNQGTVNVSNSLGSSQETMQIALDSIGNGSYEFSVGAPDLTTGKKSFFATLQIGDYSYYWDLGNAPKEAWLLGDKSTGTDFMTSGPDEITAILRDPPGSLSYAYLEKGTTITQNASNELGGGFSITAGLETDLGAKITTFVGLGAGIITDSEIVLNTETGLETSTTFKNGNETSTSTTFTERFETSSDPLYVGHLGDVFIGNSTNIQYGLTNSITIQKNYAGVDPAFTTGTGIASTYSIVPSSGLAYGKQFGTRFAFTEVELENIMIPKWQDNLALLLKNPGTAVNPGTITSPVYVSKLAKDHPDFGKLNTDKVFGASASKADKWDDGPSYTIVYPTGYKTNSAKMANFQDSVIWYNNQINRWVEVLAQNEKEKVEMQKIGNYSLGSGAMIEWSKSHTASKTETYEYSFVVSPSLGLKVGGEVCGIGMTVTTNITSTVETSGSNSSSQEESKTVGFVLQEEGDDDQITVDYGWTKSGTIAFKSRGGRTSCPYEGLVLSKYYNPGTVLSEATMQIEVPKISVASASKLLNVPANRTASFELNLKNESETKEDVWFQLIVNEETNPDGAELKIDGIGIGNGRLFMVKAGEVLKKTLTLAKGPNADIYNNIGLILRSQCQHDPTSFLPSIGDTTYVSAEFVPACSDVIIKEPVANWITNTGTGDSIRVVLQGYDVHFANFGYVQLEYRPVSSPTWNTLMSFYSNETLYNAAQGYKTLLKPTDQNIVYMWRQKTIPDGNYELRATTVCLNQADGIELSRYSAPAVAGVKDMVKPAPLGLPSPANGILAAGDELSILFNEDIQTGMLTKNNFTISGILNGRSMAEPSVGVALDGTGVAYTEQPVYSNGSFSIETWFKRTPSTAGTLFAFGSNENYISLGFDAAGKAVLAIGSESYTSTEAISNTDEWKYVSMVYNRANKNASVYLFQGSDPAKTMFNAKAYIKEPETQGKLYLGAKADKTNGFKGAISSLHLWKEVRDIAAVAADMHNSKAGNERNLAGYWELNEGKGVVAVDKAMARNLTLKTNWYVYPAGKAVTLNGSNYVTINSGEFPFREYDNFSVECWFKGGSQNAATLFSCGHGISDKDLNGRLSVAVDANKQLILRANGNTQVISTTNVLDNNWNHLALTVKQNGMLNVYINGKVSGQFNSSVIGSLQGSEYTFGACRYNNATGVSQTTEYFTGSMDEIRVWNTALTSDVINLNMNSKLRGNEAGLLAYYPFEKYIKESNGLVTVTETKSDMVNASLTAGGTITYNNAAPAMMDCRPVQDVNFDFVSSNNKVVFTLNNELKELEGVILEITANKVYDLRGNMSVPEKWTAFVNMNGLKWDTDAVELVMEASSTKSFTATIVNKSGENKDYILQNIPSWLSVAQTQGTLKPLASKEIVFNVANGVNIGSYEESIVLTGISGINEMLPVRLKVTGQKPTWTVNPHDFESTMNITGQIRIEGAYQEDTDDLLAAFINDQCVGVTSPVYIASSNACFTFMDVYGNTEHSGQTLKFRLWDASTGHIYPNVELTGVTGGIIRFNPSDMFGNVNAPVVHNALNIIEQQIALSKGWTWFSANVANNSPALIEQFKTNVGAAGELLKAQVNYIENFSSTWVGTLTDLTNTNMFAAHTNKDHTLKLEGRPVDVLSTSLSLVNGWNWIGYTPQFSLSVKNALAGINAQEGDQIKGQSGYCTYMGANGWIGSLNYMQPGKGYMYYSTNAQTQSFTYPNIQESMLKSATGESAIYENKWTTDYHRFANNMTMTSIALLDGNEVLSNNVEVAAFCGDDCRGSILLQHVPILPNPYIGFLMVYGVPGETFEFRMYDHETGKEYAGKNQTAAFESNKRYGTLGAPYALEFVESVTGNNGATADGISIYPNPVATTLWIKRGVETIDLLEVVDLSGRIVYSVNDFNEESINLSGMSSGYYLLRLTIGDKVYHQQFTKK